MRHLVIFFISPLLSTVIYGQSVKRLTGFKESIYQGNQFLSNDTTSYIYSGNRGSNTGVVKYDTALTFQFDLQTGSLSPSKLMTQTFDASDNVLTRTEQVWQSNSWVNTTKMSCAYNLSNQTIDSTIQNWIQGQWKNMFKFSNHYTSSGLRDTTYYYLWQGNMWIDGLTQYVYHYNTNSQLDTTNVYIIGSLSNVYYNVYSNNKVITQKNDVGIFDYHYGINGQVDTTLSNTAHLKRTISHYNADTTIAFSTTETNIMSVWMYNNGIWSAADPVDTLKEYSYSTISTATPTVLSEKANLRIYPVPATDVLNIDIAGKFSATIYDCQGRKVATSNSNQVDISNFAPGIYVVVVNAGGQLITTRCRKD